MESAGVHIGQSVRAIRLLKGIKQETFAREIGIAQQNVSKMEKQKVISVEKLEAAAKVLGVTVETIKSFNEKVLFNNNIALEQNAGQIVHPVKEVIEHFEKELSKKDKQIARLSAELEAYKYGKKKPANSIKKKASKGLRSISSKTA